MAKEDRFYAFIIAHTSRSRARVQRIRVEKRLVTILSIALLLIGVGLFYGLYGLTQHAAHIRIEFENQRAERGPELPRIACRRTRIRIGGNTFEDNRLTGWRRLCPVEVELV